jgi:hypothetical protein
MPAHSSLPSGKRNFHQMPKIERTLWDTTYLNNLPPSGQLISELLLDARDGSNVSTLLHLVVCADCDLARLCISEYKNFLR